MPAWPKPMGLVVDEPANVDNGVAAPRTAGSSWQLTGARHAAGRIRETGPG